MKKLFLLLLPVLFASVLPAQNWGEQVAYDVSTKYDVYAKTYGYSDTPFLVTDLRQDSLYDPIESFNIKNLTVYRPYDGNNYLNKRPVVFFVHGGAWIDGYSFWYKFVSQSLSAEKGWILVSADYRLTSDSVFIADEYCPDKQHCTDTVHRTKAAWYPDDINDVAEAFSWTVNSIDSLGGDTNNIFIFGHSAGAHLVSLLATHTSFENLKPHIRGVVSMSGAYQLKSLDMFMFADAIDQTFHGGHQNNDAELDEASPMVYISSGMQLPIFQLLHCSMDLPSLPEQKILFTNQLDYYGLYNENVFFNGFSHVTEMTSLKDIDSEPAQRITQFIEGHLYHTDVKEIKPENGASLTAIIPNPANDMVQISYSLAQRKNVVIEFVDMKGKTIKSLPQGNLQQGNHILKLSVARFPKGVSFVTLKTGTRVIAKKLIVH